MGKGINYGTETSNLDVATGIRYGVIHQNDVLQAWCDSSTPAYSDACPYCGNGEGLEAGMTCPECDNTLTHNDFDCQENLGCDYNQDGYFATSGAEGDIFIIRSPYYTKAAFCSPCAPGACYLTNPCDDGEKAYCFGHDWFDEGKAPYPVYDVKTNEMIQPEDAK